MNRSTPLRRTPLKRGESMLRRTALKARSAKKAREDRTRLAVKEQLVKIRGPWCEARTLLPKICQGLAVDAHERKRRSQGGSAIDPDNIVLLCRACHRFVTENPESAHALGLVVWSWESGRWTA